MYFIKVFSKSRDRQLAKFRNYISLTFQDELNKPSQATLTISTKDYEANLLVFSKFNRVSIFNESNEKWRGFISDIQGQDQAVTISISQISGFLKRRHVNKNFGLPNVVSVYKFDEGSGNTAIDDNINNRNGLITNCNYVSGLNGYDGDFALNMMNTNSRVDVDNEEMPFSLFQKGFTLSALIKLNPTATGSRILDKSTTTSGGAGFSFYYDHVNKRLAFVVNGSTVRYSTPNSILADGTIYRVSVTVAESGTINFYINNVQSGSLNQSGGNLSGITTTNPLTIGNRSITNNIKFDGIIDDVIVISSVLNPEEVMKLPYTGKASLIFEDIIKEMNLEFQTEFEFASSNFKTSHEQFDFQYTSVFDALTTIASSQKAEIEFINGNIDAENTKTYIRLVAQVGEDKSDLTKRNGVVFKYLQDRIFETNIERPNYAEEGSDQANYIIGKNSESGDEQKISIQQEIEIGDDRVEKVVTFTGINSQEALDKATADYLERHKNSRNNPILETIYNKLDDNLYNIGDLCNIKLKYGFVNLDLNYRIVRKSYTVTNGGENVKVTVETSNNSLTRENFFARFASLEKRIGDLER